ncbi:hypothetical protein AAGG74_17820 [Bacillus mexicanus]|uniref:hypothetical protein n=1 Tax=Bacillus mexicanus TaxID=2834415 RepID=UPI003D23C66E
MTGKELISLYKSGKEIQVEFTEEVLEQETRFEEGMRAYISGITEPDEEGMIIIQFEERGYKEFNKSMETPKYFTGEPGVYEKYSDSKYHKSFNGKETLYEMDYLEMEKFTIIDEGSKELFQRYLKEGQEMSYVNWLESLVLKH